VKKSWSIHIDKDYLKFSAAHFLIFPDGSAERLHGHNYRVFVDLEADLDEHGLVLNFREIKPLVRELVDELDEHLLIPGEHPVLTCKDQGSGSTEILYRDRRYSIPSAEVIVLPIGNTSAENLAGWIADSLLARLADRFPGMEPKLLRVGVEETPGQRGIIEVRPS
jgi:6-pyruvoyltetrahydropterin/6-carboxytetrahydropterin synthase